MTVIVALLYLGSKNLVIVSLKCNGPKSRPHAVPANICKCLH